jgi:hypothetical protein
MRFALAGVLLSYGFSKVLPLQFPRPLPSTLAEPYGQSSPMGLLWTFMGFSPAYEAFGGWCEVIPALLLLFRRTATAGALAACTVLLNVVLLNFCFDVPVKLYSSLYLAMALFLLLPDAGPLWRFFVAQRDAKLTGIPLPLSERRVLRFAATVLQVLVIGHMLWISVGSSYAMWRKGPPKMAAPAVLIATAASGIDGSWVVDSSSGWPPASEWKTVTIGSIRYGGVDYIGAELASGITRNYSETTDLQSHIHFLRLDDTELTWSVDAHGIATLEGKWKGQPARLTMHACAAGTTGAFPLMTRGFHWVQEYPYGR